MPGTFEDLGVAPELLHAADEMGWTAPSGLQADAVPVIRRGNNVVIYASRGAGTVGAYGLGILDRLRSNAADTADGVLRALVLVPSADDASRAATTLARLAAPAGLSVRALAPGWPDRAADILVAAAAEAMDAVRDSSLKLDTLAALVVDGADRLAALGEWAAVETLMTASPAEAQRVLVTARFGDPIDGLIERHVRKALTIPPRPSDDPGATPRLDTPIRYYVVEERNRAAAAMAGLALLNATEVAVVCRDDARCARAHADLGARGVDFGDQAERRVRVLSRLDADQRTTRADVLSYDAPMDAAGLTELHGDGGIVLVSPAHLTHLRVLARRTGAKLEALRLPPAQGRSAADLVRDRLREILEHGELAADLALVEPLMEEYPAAEIAAAALLLGRTAGPPARTASPAPSGGGAPARDRTSAPGAPPPPTTWVRLFIGAGSRDGIGPGDLVGAITGESGLKGEQVGKIDVRESHSTVEVPGEAAESVIKALNGRSLRGRSLRVDYDRKERTQRRPPTRGGGKPGGPSRGPSGRSGPPRGGRGGPRPGGRD
jgi:ATP-dependent RNA helicase DeaD